MGVPFRFIHAADLHVDSPFRGLSAAPPHVREALEDSTFRAASRLVDEAIRRGADFVVVSGDLYDAADRSLRAQLVLQREWERLHAEGVRLFIIHGNHDHLGGERAQLDWPDSAVVFGSGQVGCAPAYRKDGQLAAYVYGMSYGERAVAENIALRYKPRAVGPYHIALLHGNVDGDSAHDPYAPCALADLAGGGFDYWALGHIHTRAVLHRYPHVVYAGNTQGRHARETGPKGCYIVDVSAAKETTLTFAPLDAVRWETASVPIDGLESEQALLDAMEVAARAAKAAAEARHLMVKLRFEGRGPMHRKLTDPVFEQELLEGLRARLDDGVRTSQADSGAPGWIWPYALDNHTGNALDWKALAKEDSFAGEFVRLCAAIEGDGAVLTELAGEALAPLAANPRLRRIVRDLPEAALREWVRQAKELAAGMLAEEADQTASGTGAGGGEIFP
ncbi:metallophosphoesterase family protein [Paenibacillus humicola]|uniref:metallophosphoesterase family protein n=1 Tax=Paenibacillus humicola TaxID=3110540 RepID=UPI00237C406E|nr:DNA repair exonuclease [Paenibacillus humicola]